MLLKKSLFRDDQIDLNPNDISPYYCHLNVIMKNQFLVILHKPTHKMNVMNCC